MQNKLYSFSNFIETRYSINELSNGFEIVKTLTNVLTKKVTTKVYKTIHVTYLKAVLFIDKCMKISRTMCKLWSKARKLAIDAKATLSALFLRAAKVELAEDLAKEEAYVNKFGSH